MNEKSIRDELALEMNDAYDLATGMAVRTEQFLPCADYLLTTPVIRRIQAEALIEAVAIASTYDTGYDTTAATIAEALSDRAEDYLSNRIDGTTT